MSESQPSPQKKPRLRNSDGDSDKITRSQYWFEDGNVVLQTEKTLFRVHRSILSRHSEIFKDTFAMPQGPSEENECIEGCPVVPLSDTAEDMNNVISLLYDLDKMFEFGRSIPSRVVGSMLRLGRKYVIPCLEKEALRRLHHDFPTTLEKWDSSEVHQIKDVVDNDLPTVLEVISIAHEFRLFTILPATYAKYLELQFLGDFPNDTCIPEKVRQCCLIGYARILEFIKKANTNALCPPLILPSETCSSNSKCEAVKWKAIRNLPIWDTEESSTFGVFSQWELLGPQATYTGRLCLRCRVEVKKLTDQIRADFWSILPSFFGLGLWEDLKDEF